MKRYIKYFGLLLPVLILLTSCKKASYLTDEGVHEIKSPLSTYEYLKQHPYHLFDSLILIVDKYGLKDEMNNAGTVFAVTDYSISKFINFKRQSGNYTMETLYQNLSADTIRQYFLKDRVNRNALGNEAPKLYANNGKITTAIKKTKSPDYGQWSGAPVYVLYYLKVVDGLDQTIPVGKQDIQVRCQTADIETSSGGILNVLDNSHVFANF